MKSTHRPDSSEQLALLHLPATPAPAQKVPARFRLPEHTRQLGLRQVAKIRRQLQEQAARQHPEALPVPPLPVHQHRDAA